MDLNTIFREFITLFVVIDPIGSIPVFLFATKYVPRALHRRFAIRAVAVATAVLLGFLFFGQLVLEAAQLTREGKLTAQEIAHEMERRRELLDVSFLVERLDFLHKGGRCSGVGLLGANMLNLRPCIQVKDGQMMVGKKYRGPYVSCLLQYIRERLKGRDDIDTRRIFITESGGFTPEELAQVEAAVRSYQPFDEVLHTRAGCTVSSHCGPRTLGILYFHTK